MVREFVLYVYNADCAIMRLPIYTKYAVTQPIYCGMLLTLVLQISIICLRNGYCGESVVQIIFRKIIVNCLKSEVML